MKSQKMQVELWSDITCNYCYTAKRKFDDALSQFTKREHVQIAWKSLELNPELRTDPKKHLPQFLTELLGISPDKVKEMTDHVESVARQSGIEINSYKIIPANSFNAHRLSKLSKAQNLQDKAEERLYKAYFTEGKNIDDIPTLIQLGIEVGLDEIEVRTALEGPGYADEVRQDNLEAAEFGIKSAPHFVFNKKITVSGAQDSSVFLDSLEKAFVQWQAENRDSVSDLSDGQTCKIGEICH